ncbi:MAG: MoxR family ATPase, partial [Lachnospiraceae bacterium]|nr:MoxR family ATPase [Lachnospiraceae bacterium]
MNIKEAKEYIKQTARIYLKKNELGDYVIPVVRQRPIFLLGAPGVGKTAVMEQIAQELGIALVSYSMTHHTRQSALGLPFIQHKNFDGMETDVSEYTMSEIIATIYEMMEESRIREGILFLDEINCVSETLAPSMLQFLQYKVFGKHRVPEGWVIVTAGNPPEYNKSVREFDVAVLDRMKVMEVEPDYAIFKEYAVENSLHPAIINFLDMKRDYFYRIENTVKGKSYVTARGWEDLSEIIKLYEEEGYRVDETLIDQYIRNNVIKKEFGAYYDLFNKYKRDYHVKEILEGTAPEGIEKKAQAAGFDERLSLLSMLIDKVVSDMKDCIHMTDHMTALSPILKQAVAIASGENAGSKAGNASGGGSLGNDQDRPRQAEDHREISEALIAYFDGIIENDRRRLNSLKKAGAISKDDEQTLKRTLIFMEEARKELLFNDMNIDSVKSKYNDALKAVKEDCAQVSAELKNLFDFSEKAFEDGNEML